MYEFVHGTTLEHTFGRFDKIISTISHKYFGRFYTHNDTILEVQILA